MQIDNYYKSHTHTKAPGPKRIPNPGPHCDATVLNAPSRNSVQEQIFFPLTSFPRVDTKTVRNSRYLALNQLAPQYLHSSCLPACMWVKCAAARAQFWMSPQHQQSIASRLISFLYTRCRYWSFPTSGFMSIVLAFWMHLHVGYFCVLEAEKHCCVNVYLTDKVCVIHLKTISFHIKCMQQYYLPPGECICDIRWHLLFI